MDRLKAGLEPIADYPRPLDADVICLQEITPTESKHRTDPAQGLARLLGGLNVVSASTLKLPEDQAFDEAVLSRFALSGCKAHALGEKGWVYAIEATLGSKFDEMRVFSVHAHATWRLLDAEHVRHTSQTRVAQIEALAKIARDAQGTIVMAGDFNAGTGTREYEILTGQLEDFGIITKDAKLTLPSPLPLMRFDYVFGRGEYAPISYRVLDTRLSDHRPVLVEIERKRTEK